VIHAMPGYLGPAAFANQIDFATTLYERMYPGGKRSNEAAEIYLDVHKAAGGDGMKDHGAIVHLYLSTRPLADVKRFGTRYLLAVVEEVRCGPRKPD